MCVCLQIIIMLALDSKICLSTCVADMINEMIACNDKSALQVLMVSGGTFDGFVSLLLETTVRYASVSPSFVVVAVVTFISFMLFRRQTGHLPLHQTENGLVRETQMCPCDTAPVTTQHLFQHCPLQDIPRSAAWTEVTAHREVG